MSELLPCPFCGGDAHVSTLDAGVIRYNPGCATAWCRGHNTLLRTEAEAIAAWNLRAPPASPTGRQLGHGKRDELPPIVSEGVVAELVEALRPFAAIKPSSWYPEDGAEGEDYIVLLRGNYANPPAFNAADLARARSALSKATGEGG